MLTRIGIALLAVCSLSQWVSSCRNSDAPSSETLAITNRSLNKEPYKLLMLKLKTPALLSTASHEKKTLLIDPLQKEALLKEQEETELFLKTLSREIKILHRYRFVLNGFSILIPTRLVGQLKGHAGIAEVHASQGFSRPDDLIAGKAVPKVGTETSAKFIGAYKVHDQLHLDGTGVRVGVIDTGIDYTHIMLGGAGTEIAYLEASSDKARDISYSGYPNKKVVGGIDLVGSEYDDASGLFAKRIPMPDNNPLDESGHGSHVAGTIAGIGDGENTYTGIAPGAQLYAIKVFGRDGSTSDAVVIAGMEYAVNPSGNLDPNDHLDVVNLSLGSPYGLPYRLYDEAMKNLAKADVVAVTSAGNSGNIPYIVGAPSSSDDTISVAASIDNMDQNWKFRAVLFKVTGDDGVTKEIPTKAIVASFSKPLESVGDLVSKLVYIGLANDDLSDEQKAALQGNIALIDRGGSSYSDKMIRAVQAGAVGVVVANNVDGEPTSMGGSGPFNVPAIMISKDLGSEFKKEMSKKHEVTLAFHTDQKIEEAALIDTLTGFSSRGPRSLDSGIKPEITAPGSNILSAKFGGGSKAASMSGTSMAAPHVSGCVALMKQAYPTWNNEQIKSALMASSVTLRHPTGYDYPISRQGAGRVDIFAALSRKALTILPASIGLGEVEVVQKKELRNTITLENHTSEAMLVYFQSELPSEITVDISDSVRIEANSKTVVPYTVFIEAPAKSRFKEVYGFIKVRNEQGEVLAKIATLGVVRRLSLLKAESLKVHAGHKEDAESAPAELTLRNDGPAEAQALVFNYLGENSRKDPVGPERRTTDICDLESVAYRTIEKGEGAEKAKFLQFAAKLHSPLTSWEHCELSVQIDGDGDGKVDQELIGGSVNSLVSSEPHNVFQTILTDANKMRDIRIARDLGQKGNFKDAIVDIQDLKIYNHGTLMILNVPLTKLHVRPFGLLKVKIASLASADPLSTPDDYLGGSEKHWWTIDPFELASPYYGMPEEILIPAHSSMKVPLTHGESTGDLIVYYPTNKSTRSAMKDLQSELVKEEFLYK